MKREFCEGGKDEGDASDGDVVEEDWSSRGEASCQSW